MYQAFRILLNARCIAPETSGLVRSNRYAAIYHETAQAFFHAANNVWLSKRIKDSKGDITHSHVPLLAHTR